METALDSAPVSTPDPGAVDLEKVANVIVDHSLQDCVFSKEAGRMCYAIIQVGGSWQSGSCLENGTPGSGTGWPAEDTG